MSELSFRLVEGASEELVGAQKWMVFLHGLLGSKSNWQSIAKRFVEARSEITGLSWGAVLVDLRMHGDSQEFDAPYSIETAARDLEILKDKVPGKICGVVGHSLGGKVALAWSEMQEALFEEVWLIDAPPWNRPSKLGSEDTARLLDWMEGISYPVESRDAFVKALKNKGVSEGTAKWVAMNLKRTQVDFGREGGFELKVEMGAIRALFKDVFLQDYSAAFEKPTAQRMVLVVGEKSGLFSKEDLVSVKRLAKENPQVEFYVIEGAGHWVHAEKPAELLAILVR